MMTTMTPMRHNTDDRSHRDDQRLAEPGITVGDWDNQDNNKDERQRQR